MIQSGDLTAAEKQSLEKALLRLLFQKKERKRIEIAFFPTKTNLGKRFHLGLTYTVTFH